MKYPVLKALLKALSWFVIDLIDIFRKRIPFK